MPAEVRFYFLASLGFHDDSPQPAPAVGMTKHVGSKYQGRADHVLQYQQFVPELEAGTDLDNVCVQQKMQVDRACSWPN